MQAKEAGYPWTEWSQKDHAVFLPSTGLPTSSFRFFHSILCNISTWPSSRNGWWQTEGLKKKNNLVLLTQRENKVSKLKAGYEYQEILKNKSDFKVQNLPLMLSSCHDDGSRTLWLPKLENAIYQKPFNVMYYFFSNNPLASEK